MEFSMTFEEPEPNRRIESGEDPRVEEVISHLERAQNLVFVEIVGTEAGAFRDEETGAKVSTFYYKLAFERDQVGGEDVPVDLFVIKGLFSSLTSDFLRGWLMYGEEDTELRFLFREGRIEFTTEYTREQLTTGDMVA
jgi:hypothetical protein